MIPDSLKSRPLGLPGQHPQFGWIVVGLLLTLASVVWIYATPRYVEYVLSEQRIGPAQTRNVPGDGTIPGREPGELAVVFFDVRYGDGILVQAPENVTSLIDGGEGQYPEEEQAPVYDWAYQLYVPFLNTIGLHEFKNFVSTVPYSHHMGAQTDLLANRKLSVENAYWTGYRAQFSAHRRYRVHADQKANSRVLGEGDSINFGPGVESQVVYARDAAKLKPRASRVLVLQYGERRFLFTSDLPREDEETMVLRWGSSLEADVLKVGTHGGDDSTGKELVEYVQPEHAVISVAEKGSNPLGAPKKSVLKNLKSVGATVHKTFRHGHVAFYTDGESLRVRRDAFPWVGS